jgi:urease accessory protein
MSGVAVLDRSQFTSLSASYPLKFITPTRTFSQQTSIPKLLYLVNYGGGLVHGDSVDIDIKILNASSLLILTQGTTKVFKSSPERISSGTRDDTGTTQVLSVVIDANSSLFYLPSPVTLFATASMIQIQRFELSAKTSNLLLLDWYTSGRKFSKDPEFWSFDKFDNLIEIVLDKVTLVWDRLLLESTQTSTIASRLSPYSIYMSLYIAGPLLQSVYDHFQSSFNSISQHKHFSPSDLLWSFTPIQDQRNADENFKIGLVRAAANETEDLKSWLRVMLRAGGIKEMFGESMWRNAFN